MIALGGAWPRGGLWVTSFHRGVKTPPWVLAPARLEQVGQSLFMRCLFGSHGSLEWPCQVCPQPTRPCLLWPAVCVSSTPLTIRARAWLSSCFLETRCPLARCGSDLAVSPRPSPAVARGLQIRRLVSEADLAFSPRGRTPLLGSEHKERLAHTRPSEAHLSPNPCSAATSSTGFRVPVGAAVGPCKGGCRPPWA